MRVLGIDPGTLTTGYGIVEKGQGGRLIHVCDGEIKAASKKALSERLLVIGDSLKKVIAEFSPDCMAVESVFFARNVKSALVLGHARGVVFFTAAAMGVSVFEYSPRKVKQAVTGYGGAEKGQVQKMVSLLLRTTPLQGPDAADALALAICHIHHAPPRAPLRKCGGVSLRQAVSLKKL